MATATPTKMSARSAAVAVLTDSGAPMHVKDIAEKVLSDYDTGLKGKTPTATLAAQLHLAAKKGILVTKVGPGTFALLNGTAAEPAPDSPAVTPNSTVIRNGHEARTDFKKEKAAPKRLHSTARS